MEIKFQENGASIRRLLNKLKLAFLKSTPLREKRKYFIYNVVVQSYTFTLFFLLNSHYNNFMFYQISVHTSNKLKFFSCVICRSYSLTYYDICINLVFSFWSDSIRETCLLTLLCFKKISLASFFLVRVLVFYLFGEI